MILTPKKSRMKYFVKGILFKGLSEVLRQSGLGRGEGAEDVKTGAWGPSGETGGCRSRPAESQVLGEGDQLSPDQGAGPPTPAPSAPREGRTAVSRGGTLNTSPLNF